MYVILPAHRANESFLDADLGNMNYCTPLKKELEQSLAGAINLSFIQGFSPLPCLTSAQREELHHCQTLNTHHHKHFGPGTRDGTHTNTRCTCNKGRWHKCICGCVGSPSFTSTRRSVSQEEKNMAWCHRLARPAAAVAAVLAAASESFLCTAPEEREADMTQK